MTLTSCEDFLYHKELRYELTNIKARFVAGARKDLEKFQLIHNFRTVRPDSVRIVFQVAAQFGWRLWVDDINQPNIKSGKNCVASST